MKDRASWHSRQVPRSSHCLLFHSSDILRRRPELRSIRQYRPNVARFLLFTTLSVHCTTAAWLNSATSIMLIACMSLCLYVCLSLCLCACLCFYNKNLKNKNKKHPVNNNNHDDISSAVITAEPLREFTRFIRWIQKRRYGARWPPTFGPTKPTDLSRMPAYIGSQ